MMSMDELIAKFSIDHCSRAGAKFAYEKGRWFNHEYLQLLPDAELAELFKPVMRAHGVDPEAFSDEYITRAVGMVKSRINFVADLWDHARFFFVAPDTYEEKSVKKRWNEDTPRIMGELQEQLRALPSLESKAAEETILKWITDNGYHMGNVMNAFRLAVVGECKGPHMFDITELLGLDETVARLAAAVERLG